MLWKTALIVLATILCAALAEHTRVKRRMYAMCPPNFKRIGSECYFISSSRLNWLDAHFECKDKNSKLAEPGSSADRKLRSYLIAMDTDPDEIWIGGCYDWNTHKWHWGYNGKEITHQSFSQLDPGSSQDLRYHCAVLNPSIKYRWSAQSSVDRHRFICQHKMPKVSEKNRFKVYNRWNETYPNQLANEVLLEIVDSGENGTRSFIKTRNATYAVDCKIRRVTHRRVKAVDNNDVFTIPIKRRENAVRRRRKRPHTTTPGYQGTEPYTISPLFRDSHVINGNIGAHEIKDSIAQFAPENRHDFKPSSTKNDDEETTLPSIRIRGRGKQRQNRPDSNFETNETILNPKPNKPRQRTEFDREIELKRRRTLQRRRKMEQHRKWRLEQREKAKKEKEEQERIQRAKEEERLRYTAEREAEEKRRIEEQKEIKRKQMEELEALKQQQIEEVEREREQAEQAQKRRKEIEKQQHEAKERQENERLEKERLDAEQNRLEEEERLRKQKVYEEEFEKRRQLEYEEKEKEEERLRQSEVRKLQEEKQQQEEEYRRIQEEREKEEQKRVKEELERIEEEARRREENQKARDAEIKRREELLKQQEEEEKRLQEEIRRREEEEKIAREEEQRRKEEEKRQKEEEERRKKQEQEEKRRLKELRRQKAESNRQAIEEEEKRIKLQKLRERLAKLTPEEQQKFWELKQQRKRKRAKNNSENESIIPE